MCFEINPNYIHCRNVHQHLIEENISYSGPCFLVWVFNINTCIVFFFLIKQCYFHLQPFFNHQ